MMRRVVNAKCVTQFANIAGMDEFDTSAKRLKWAREHRSPYKRPADAADEFGWTKSTYYGHENGGRNLSREAAKRYAAVYKVPWLWLFDGSGPSPWEASKTAKPGALPISSAGRRIENIRRALCPDLPNRLGINNDVVWSALIDQPGGLHPRLAALTAEATGLPLTYIEDADPSGLTRKQLVALVHAFLTEGQPR